MSEQERVAINSRVRAQRERYMRELIECPPVNTTLRCDGIDPRYVRCAECGKMVKDGRFLGTFHLCL
jgi:hypothetical protein